MELEARESFLARLRAAVRDGRGFAAGRVSPTCAEVLDAEQAGRSLNPLAQTVLYRAKADLARRQSGFFPATAAFLPDFARYYREEIRALDSVGLYGGVWAKADARLAESLRLRWPTHFLNHEPDRSSPYRAEACYLPALRGRRILLVCPFAGFLKERARKETFEAVWAKIGLPWFEPASVEALEFPYGFEPATVARFGTIRNLIGDIEQRMAGMDFDVALVAAAFMAVPLVAAAKRTGRVGIDLGGHLQILFGVYGKRWLEWPEWRDRYFNEAWTRVPAGYRPGVAGVCDDGAYW